MKAERVADLFIFNPLLLHAACIVQPALLVCWYVSPSNRQPPCCLTSAEWHPAGRVAVQAVRKVTAGHCLEEVLGGLLFSGLQEGEGVGQGTCIAHRLPTVWLGKWPPEQWRDDVALSEEREAEKGDNVDLRENGRRCERER
eukprot:365958-Chlamydomonas_euryale.AAC.8